MLTETEAKAKWCPMRPSIARVNIAARMVWWITGRKPSSYDHSLPGCVGNACALWRWIDEDRRIEIFPKNLKESDQQFAARRDKMRNARRGYCGLGQKPRFNAVWG